MLNKNDLMEYAAACGSESAANLLLLIGPDSYGGPLDEYEDLERKFQEGEINE